MNSFQAKAVCLILRNTFYYLRLHYHIEIKDPQEVYKWEDAFVEEIKKRGEEFKYYQDQFGEHPDDRVTKDDVVTGKLGDLQTLTNIFGGIKTKVISVIQTRYVCTSKYGITSPSWLF